MLNVDEKLRAEAKARSDNANDGWGFSGESLFRLIMRHKYGDDATKAYVEERLTDANFHTTCAFVRRGYYDAAMTDFYEDFMRGRGGLSDEEIENSMRTYWGEVIARELYFGMVLKWIVYLFLRMVICCL